MKAILANGIAISLGLSITYLVAACVLGDPEFGLLAITTLALTAAFAIAATLHFENENSTLLQQQHSCENNEAAQRPQCCCKAPA